MPGRPLGVVDDTFQRSDRNLDGDRSPSGTSYLVHGGGDTGLAIRSNRLVRSQPSSFGPSAGPILIWPFHGDPSGIAANFVFTPGSTKGQSVVIGACAEAFSQSSIQLAVTPARWLLFYTLKRQGQGNGTDVVTIAAGIFGRAEPTDGQSVLSMSMTVDLAASSVTISYPSGARSISNPVIAKYWGKRVGVQIRRPSSTDGDAQVTEVRVVAPR
jgi:hypothetical protein